MHLGIVQPRPAIGDSVHALFDPISAHLLSLTCAYTHTHTHTHTYTHTHTHARTHAHTQEVVEVLEVAVNKHH